ncbi:hypothetical protein GGR54DRAFT_647649 [Hypoxylon sp. NC1633]|nr:hypothetical protein GGR54DRAFT_647649 [Hypoxylon sp. NC1633]
MANEETTSVWRCKLTQAAPIATIPVALTVGMEMSDEIEVTKYCGSMPLEAVIAAPANPQQMVKAIICLEFRGLVTVSRPKELTMMYRAWTMNLLRSNNLAVGSFPVSLTYSESLSLTDAQPSRLGQGFEPEILRDCSQAIPIKGGSPPSQDRTSSNPTSNIRSTKSPAKKVISDAEGDHDGDSAAPSTATVAPSVKANERPKLACPFYKMNQHLYSACRHSGFSQISHLGDHLRKKHKPNDHSCRKCWRPFDNAAALEAHAADSHFNICRPTEGVPPDKLQIKKTHTGNRKKWFSIWDDLFPVFQKPKSPYMESVDHDKPLLSTLRECLLAHLPPTFPPRIIEVALDVLASSSENWATNPPEPRGLATLPVRATTQASSDEGQHRASTHQCPSCRQWCLPTLP